VSSTGTPVRVVTLRELLDGPEPVIAPGAYDALSARLVEQAGFGAVYMTGFGASASLLGRPDVGLLSFGEMVDHARRLVQAVGVPVIADADDGYGNPLNVLRTVREYEAAGVAALHLEDQVSPKRCGHLEGKDVIPAGEMVEKVRAAVEARSSDELVIIARTDARAVEGLDAALERARLYREAGADVLFVEAPESEDEVAAVAQAFPDTPLLFNAIEGGRTPLLELDRLHELGFRLILWPLTALFAAAQAVQEALARLHAHRAPAGDGALPFEAFTDAVGLPEVQRLEARFAVSDS
jgi:2,3-dimethylmalate lyase